MSEWELVDVKSDAGRMSLSEWVNSQLPHGELDLTGPDRPPRQPRPDGCWCNGKGGRNPISWDRGGGQFVFVEYCSCPEGIARRAVDDALKAVTTRAHVEQVLSSFRAGVPRHFREYTLSTYPATMPRQRAVQSTIRRWVDACGTEEPWLFLHGPYGTGKTGLAVGAAAALIETGIEPGAFVFVSDLLDRLRQTYRKDADEDEVDIMEQYRDAGVLILDDLGAGSHSPWAVERLLVLVNYRHGEELPTIITSNLDLLGLASAIAERTVHRIDELAKVVSLEGCMDLRDKRPQRRLHVVDG